MRKIRPFLISICAPPHALVRAEVLQQSREGGLEGVVVLQARLGEDDEQLVVNSDRRLDLLVQFSAGLNVLRRIVSGAKGTAAAKIAVLKVKSAGIHSPCWYECSMRKALAPKTAQRSENAVLDQAIQQLLGATKDAAKKKGKPLDPAQLRKEGYSERFIDKVENA